MPKADTTTGAPGAPGRPPEIEPASNRLLIHPLARALVDVLVATPVTPNQVSIASVAAAGAAAAAYLWAPWPWNALIGLAFQIAWHVLDGADGDLARRTGRASPIGELIDGVCDHVSQALIYIALALLAQKTVGAWAWAAAAAAGVSHFCQANAYETGRKAYRRFVYGAPWMRQTGAGEGGAGAALARLYIGVSDLMSPGEARCEEAMDWAISLGGASAEAARALYRQTFAPIVRAGGVLGSNPRTLIAFLAVLIDEPLWFFLAEFSFLNVSLLALAVARGGANATMVKSLGRSAQAAAAPN